MRLVNSLTVLALAAIARSNPLAQRDNSCLTAVTGNDDGQVDQATRVADCQSYLANSATTSRPAWWHRWTGGSPAATIPGYAQTCDADSYKSACSQWSNTLSKKSSVTVRPNMMQQWGAPACLNDTRATYFVNGFKELLEYTSYNGNQGPPGRGYPTSVSNAILASDFQDFSDSINWMAGIPLGTVTFANKTAFDYGQGVLQPELKVTTMNIWHNCNTITWRWSAITSSNANVRGINVMVLDPTLSKIQTNYAEFDNAAWLYSFGLQCKPPSSSS